MAMKSKLRTSVVVVFSIQSLRRSASRAESLASWSLVLARRLEPLVCLAIFRCNRRLR